MKKLLPVVLLFIIACSGGVKNDTPLPDSIQSMVLQKVTQGQKADKAITELHHKQVTDAKNYIGEYKGDKYDAKLYLTEYDNYCGPGQHGRPDYESPHRWTDGFPACPAAAQSW